MENFKHSNYDNSTSTTTASTLHHSVYMKPNFVKALGILKKNFRGVRGSRKTATIKVNIDIKSTLQIL